MLRTFLVALLAGLCLITFSTTVQSSRYGRRICSSPKYHCLRVKRGDTWEKLFPNARQREIVKRANRMNTRLNGGMVIAVPKNLNAINHMHISPLPNQISPSANKVLLINLRVHAFGAYDRDGRLVHWGPVSGGRGYCPDVRRRCNTPSGLFHIYAKQGSGCISTKYPIGKGGAPMPFCMFFYKGFAMHASFLPGYHASHGCIRMFYEDAKWLNRNFIHMGRGGTRVIVRR